ncbi:hypothetical protein Tsubulata_045935, partial [Turnera subulata]
MEVKDCFPLEMVEEIIARLPTSSLIRLLCMSKDWYSYRSSDKLNKLRSKLAPLDEQLVKILNLTDLKFWNFNDHLKTPSNLSFPLNRYLQPVGSCNGLVCISLGGNQNDFVLWNPNTGAFRQLPKPEDDTSCYQGCPAYGFGYDSVSDDYKIFLVSVHKSDEGITQIFSLKANSWKK